MGRRSVKKEKSIYQLQREKRALTREAAADLLQTISPERLVRLENNPSAMRPEDVMELSAGYKAPELCSWYCKHDCAIGQVNARDVQLKDLTQVSLETLGALKNLNEIRDRLLEIVTDGAVTPEEYADFFGIQQNLEQIALAVDNLQLWIRDAQAAGRLPKN